jgi:hypothetical protein
MPLLLYPWGNRPRYPLDRRLGEPQNLSGDCGLEKNLILSKIEPGPSIPSLHSLSYPGSLGIYNVDYYFDFFNALFNN